MRYQNYLLFATLIAMSFFGGVSAHLHAPLSPLASAWPDGWYKMHFQDWKLATFLGFFSLPSLFCFFEENIAHAILEIIGKPYKLYYILWHILHLKVETNVRGSGSILVRPQFFSLKELSGFDVDLPMIPCGDSILL